jgi:hypothetical protein
MNQVIKKKAKKKIIIKITNPYRDKKKQTKSQANLNLIRSRVIFKISNAFSSYR